MAERLDPHGLISRIRSVLGASKIFQRPSSTRESQRVHCGCRADKLSTRRFRRCTLKTEYRLLALLGACSAKVRRVPEALFVWLSRKDVGGAVSQACEFVVGKFLSLFYNSGAALFKLEIFVLEPRQLVLQQRLACLQRENGSLSINELSEQVCGGQGNLAGVALCDKSFCKGLCATDGRDGELNFAEHGCPSDSSVRVEEPALSVGVGGPPGPRTTSGQSAN